MTFQKRLWYLSFVILAVLVLYSARIIYWQLIRGVQLQAVALDPLAAAAEYAQRNQNDGAPVPNEQGTFENLEGLPAPVLQRTIAMLRTITRGSMLDRNGNVLAEDLVDGEGNLYRSYNDPSAVFITGYATALRTGLTGLEHSYNDTLLGVNRIDAQLAMSLHEPVRGSDLILTIDEDLQRQAADGLGSRAGAVVILNGKTGAVLAMTSYPRFDPNQILDEGYAGGLVNSCNGSADCVGPFISRSTQALYTTGSTFKTVTLIAGLDTGQITPETTFDFGDPIEGPNGPYYVYRVGGGEIPDPNHRERVLNLPMSYAFSANAAFARIGAEMNPENFIKYSQRLGFSQPENQQFPLEVEYTPSKLANNLDDIRNNDLLRAATAIGQGELAASPMNMAMVVLSVLNKGDLPLPYFVEAVRSPDGTLNKNLPNRRWYRNLYSDRTAQQAHDIMVTAVREGSGNRAAVPGLVVGGKTGTAQRGGDLLPHAWFIGFAESDKASVVIVVMIEEAAPGGAYVASPLFAELAPLAIQVAEDSQ